MSLFEHDQKNVDDFFHAIEPLERGYPDCTFSYCAIREGNGFVLVHGRLFLRTEPFTAPCSHFSSASVRAGHFHLSEIGLSPRTFIEKLVSGKIPTPIEEVTFSPAPGGRTATIYAPYHPEGLKTQSRLNVLSFLGREYPAVPQPNIDWELKAASKPYDGLTELMNEYFLDPRMGPTISVEIVAGAVAFINGEKSRVSDDQAHIHVRAAGGLDPHVLSVGYRIYNQGTVTKRDMIAGSEFEWQPVGELLHGEMSMNVDRGSVLNCTVSYNGIAQSYFWIADPATTQNARRAVYEAFDPKLTTLRDIVDKAQGRGQEARDFESAVAWIFWMFGFSGAHLGNTRRTQDAADLVISTPNGNFAVVECTTGLLKADNKLAILHDRTEAARRNLAASNHAYLRVMPIIVTSKTRSEIKPDLEQAERLGILVIAREELMQAIDRTLVTPNPDRAYEEAEQAIRAGLAKYETPPN